MNYEYKFTQKKIILSEEEHQQVLSKLKAGQSTVILRNGDLLLNMSLVGTVTPTGEPSTVNEELNLLNSGNVENKQPERYASDTGFQKFSDWIKKQSWYAPRQNL